MHSEDPRKLFRDEYGRLRFKFAQRYLVPINTAKRLKKSKKRTHGSVSMIRIACVEGALVDTFYWSFRRWLKAEGVPVVQYLYQANLHEVLCGDLPEQT